MTYPRKRSEMTKHDAALAEFEKVRDAAWAECDKACDVEVQS